MHCVDMKGKGSARVRACVGNGSWGTPQSTKASAELVLFLLSQKQKPAAEGADNFLQA